MGYVAQQRSPRRHLGRNLYRPSVADKERGELFLMTVPRLRDTQRFHYHCNVIYENKTNLGRGFRHDVFGISKRHARDALG